MAAQDSRTYQREYKRKRREDPYFRRKENAKRKMQRRKKPDPKVRARVKARKKIERTNLIAFRALRNSGHTLREIAEIMEWKTWRVMKYSKLMSQVDEKAKG